VRALEKATGSPAERREREKENVNTSRSNDSKREQDSERRATGNMGESRETTDRSSAKPIVSPEAYERQVDTVGT
jgi:hypothetical protein